EKPRLAAGLFNRVFHHVSGCAGHHLAAAGRAFAGHPAARLAVAGRASGWDFDFDSSFFSSPTLVEAPLNPIRASWAKTMHEPTYRSRAVPARPEIEIGTPTPPDVFPLAKGGIDDGTLSTAMATRSTNSDSRADLVIRWLALADPGAGRNQFRRAGKTSQTA